MSFFVWVSHTAKNLVIWSMVGFDHTANLMICSTVGDGLRVCGWNWEEKVGLDLEDEDDTLKMPKMPLWVYN